MLLSYRTKANIYGVEIQKSVFDLGVKSIIENKMDKQITIINDDAKNVINLFGDDYFEETLERIRNIRSSERRFYQKITDIYATSIDYDKTSKTTLEFFKKGLNSMP